MNYSIVYSSRTGNTALLAKTIASTLPEADCLYCGPPGVDDEKADLIFIGFWTDKGGCDESISAFLNSLQGKKVFLFGTAGFGGSKEYFSKILSRIALNLDTSNELIGSYMCQGKMPSSIRTRYEAMPGKEPETARQMIANFDQALSHPDEDDLFRLKALIKTLF